MTENRQDYEYREVRAIRGTESKARLKWENEGWEYVSQLDGKLQSKLTFRKLKPRMSKKSIMLLGGAVALAFTLIIIAGAVSEKDKKPTGQPTNSETQTPDIENTTPTDTVDKESPAPEKPTTLTIENNKDLAELLASSGGDIELNRKFWKKYAGAQIEFDGNISYIDNHGSYTTRFDALIVSGDYAEDYVIGPWFRVIDAGWYDFHFGGKNMYYSVSQGDPVRVIGKIVSWNDDKFELELISTKRR
ncbi:MAG: DUF4839 domain-containing protein [Actinobacteria bacterium]|uniref:Unannotated protein n=1 Tax=freshwater metagenome TaxID=449393 RepID=A0A6J6MWA3_9ZZZZ|nr:DUF4839 domain-containing protein [Actinomycetota bacterium]